MLLTPSRPQPLSLLLLLPSSILFLAWIYARWTRPERREILDLDNCSYLDVHHDLLTFTTIQQTAWRIGANDSASFGYPQWYGKAATPFDHFAGDEETCDVKQSFLIYIDLAYDSPHVPRALQTLAVLRQAAGANVTITSPFSPNWDPVSDPAHNLASLGCADIVWHIGDAPTSHGRPCPQSLWISELVGSSSSATPIYDHQADLVLLPRPHLLLADELQYENIKAQHADFEMGLFAHVMPAADPSIFYPDRRTLRKTVSYFPPPDTPSKELPRLPWGKQWSIHRSSTPAPPEFGPDEDPYLPQSKYAHSYEQWQSKDAKALRDAGICVFDNWREGLVDERVVEAFMAGCAVAMTVPEVEHQVLGPLIIPLKHPQSHDRSLPATQIKDFLAATPTETLKQKALDAFVEARRRYTPRARVQRVLDLVKTYQSGGRGFMFPYGFQWSCSSHPRPPWCAEGT